MLCVAQGKGNPLSRNRVQLHENFLMVTVTRQCSLIFKSKNPLAFIELVPHEQVGGDFDRRVHRDHEDFWITEPNAFLPNQVLRLPIGYFEVDEVNQNRGPDLLIYKDGQFAPFASGSTPSVGGSGSPSKDSQGRTAAQRQAQYQIFLDKMKKEGWNVLAARRKA